MCTHAKKSQQADAQADVLDILGHTCDDFGEYGKSIAYHEQALEVIKEYHIIMV